MHRLWSISALVATLAGPVRAQRVTSAVRPADTLPAAVAQRSGEAMVQRRRQAPVAILLGSVRDADARPIPGTQVMIRNSALGALSDSLGHYEITGVPPGQHGVVFARIGYYRLELTDVDVAPPDTIRLDVRLAPRQVVITECLTSPPC